MAATEDNSDAIADLEEVSQSGIKRTSADGHSADVDLEHLERKLRELRLRDTDSVAAGRVRPVMVGINLRGAW